MFRALMLRGWGRYVLAFMAGICGTLALPPFFVFPLLIPAFSGLFLLISIPQCTARCAFGYGWFWGWGFYISGLYWFCIALLTDPEKFGWMIPFALFGLTAVIAIYCGIACWLFKKLFPHSTLHTPTTLFFFTSIWALVEFARGHLFTGFPWNLPGYSFAFLEPSIQLASLVGVYGLTWGAVWLGAVPALLWQHNSPSLKRKRINIILISYALFAIGLGWGAWRLYEADAIDAIKEYQVAAKLRLVQANIAQNGKWDPNTQMQGLNEHIRLMQLPGLDTIDAVIWPETAVPYTLWEHSPLTQYLASHIHLGKLLITGALHKENKGEDYEMWNSMVALDHRGEMIGRYDKHRLVPFGEFIPFRPLLPKRLLTPVGDKDFSRGAGPKTVSWGELPPISPLICYEAIFPEDAVDEKHRPQLLLNITNDAWFGTSSGPYQHFTMARMRAAEQGIPLVRVANTGISAYIDAYGRTVSKLDLGAKGVLDVNLPGKPAINTIYSKYNDLWIYCLTLTAILLTIVKRRGRIN